MGSPTKKPLLITTILALALAPLHAADPTPGKQVECKLEISDQQTVPYLLYLPRNYEADRDRKLPLMLFLHGRGESRGPAARPCSTGSS